MGIDSEGTGDGKNHKSVLLGCGDSYIANPEGFQWEEVLEFLYKCFQEKPSSVFAGFYLGYDFTMWLRSLPRERAERLFTVAGVASRRRTDSGNNPIPFPVYLRGSRGDWDIDTLGLKRVKFKPHTAKEWMYVCDAGAFFQCSFLKAIDPKEWKDPIVTEAEFAQVRQGKEARGNAELDQDMIDYMLLEIDIFQRLMREYNAGLVTAGVKLKRQQWIGPGQAAQEWMKSTELIPSQGHDTKAGYVPGLFDSIPAAVLEFARKTYYGGWFEIFAHGLIPGTVSEYDINSAYPYIMASLPCLQHGTWKHRTGHSRAIPGTGAGKHLVMVYAEVTGSNIIGPMLHRTADGTIRRPLHTKGWYWAHELAASKRAGLIDWVEISETWTFTKNCECRPPMRGLIGLYNMRLKVGKDTPLGKALKLIYNSCYGKFAQSVGHPIFGNPIYASLITAGCRTMILDAIATHPNGASDVTMVATDAVFFASPHPGLELSEALGGWSQTNRENLTQFKPGVYWDDKTRASLAKGETARFKSRGVNSAAFSRVLSDIDRDFALWESEGKREWPKVRFPLALSIVGMPQALMWGKWWMAGYVYTDKQVTQDSDPVTKRRYTPERVDKTGLPAYDGRMFRSYPWFWGDPALKHTAEETQPYTRRFGMDSEETWNGAEGLTPERDTAAEELAELLDG